MYTTQLDNGTLNNYAIEPQVYVADYPTYYEQRRYLGQAAIATGLVMGLILTCFAIS